MPSCHNSTIIWAGMQTGRSRKFSVFPLIFSLLFQHPAVAVGVEKQFQSVDLLLQAAAVVRIGNHDALRLQFDLRRDGIDIGVARQYMLDILEGVVGLDAQTVGIENQRVSRDARGFW